MTQNFFTCENICHQVHFLSCEIWTEPSHFTTHKKKLPTLVENKSKNWPKSVAIKKATNFAFVPDC